MRGHTNMVTAISTPHRCSNFILSSSRDKSIIIWRITRGNSTYGVPYRILTGHSHFVNDVVLLSNDDCALSASWDGELRLWELATATTTCLFLGHTKDVLSVAICPENRKIVSASRDGTIKLWNTIGECKFTTDRAAGGHSDWVTCVKFIPGASEQSVVSTSWDGTVKIWKLEKCGSEWKMNMKHTLVGHDGYVEVVTVAPDGTLCASGGKDGTVLLWEVNEGVKLYEFESGSVVVALCFSPTRYWLCVATVNNNIFILDLQSKQIVVELNLQVNNGSITHTIQPIYCSSLEWSADGNTLFCGYTDGEIKVWEVSPT
ncbi:hypothetical protein VNO77_33155 [Canavalia gladiata]|uniref:Guanine nucleotide-binding protein subunit beta-like protein n=1 Tax=Canavalia gladiata TaxID=3824 RepID=A0AAN9Q094_CANGL